MVFFRRTRSGLYRFLKRFLENENDFIEETTWFEPGYRHEYFKGREIIL